jgi:hypothetical protein
VHDFMDKQMGKAITYRDYDMAANRGWVTAGTEHGTRRLRRGADPPLVDHRRPGRVPRCGPAADLR